MHTLKYYLDVLIDAVHLYHLALKLIHINYEAPF